MTYQKDGVFVECSEAKYQADYKRFGYKPVEQPLQEDPKQPEGIENAHSGPTDPKPKRQVKKDA